ncbi:unnamed protein product [Diamesa serratosioi]
MCEKDLSRVSKYLKVPVGELSYTDGNIIQMKTKESKSITGYSSILNFLHSQSESNKSSEEYFLVKQFFDYSNLFVKLTAKKDRQNVCLELNSYLESRSYLCGQKVTLADVVVFYAIFDNILQLTPQDKEHYLNLSRWFNHLQQIQEISQNDVRKVNFSTVGLSKA